MKVGTMSLMYGSVRLGVWTLVCLSALWCAPMATLAQSDDGGSETEDETTDEGTDEAAVDPNAPEQLARAHFEAGQQLYSLGRFTQAADEFMEAFRLSNRPALLYNVHIAYRDAADHARSAEALRKYLELASDVPNRVSLEARLKSLEAQLAAEEADDDVVADPDAVAESTPVPAPVGSSSVDGTSIAKWSLVSGGALLVGAGLVTGAMAVRAESDIEHSCPRDQCPFDYDLEGERSRTRTLAVTTDVLMGAGAIAAGVALYLFLTDDSGAEESTGVSSASAGCDALSCHVSLGGRF